MMIIHVIIILLFFFWYLEHKQLLIGNDQYQIFEIAQKDIFRTKIVLWRNFNNEWIPYDIMLHIQVHVIISAESYASKSTMEWHICQFQNLSILVTLISYINATQTFQRMFRKVFPSAFKRSVNCWTFILHKYLSWFCLPVSFELTQ